MSAGRTARALREHSQQLETELAALTAERDAARARAARAEDNLAALEQCHDDNCRGVAKIAADLATERARLDWLISGGVCMIQHTGGFHVSRLHAPVSRAAIDAAMQEHAK